MLFFFILDNINVWFVFGLAMIAIVIYAAAAPLLSEDHPSTQF